jgi:hypothetical protein
MNRPLSVTVPPRRPLSGYWGTRHQVPRVFRPAQVRELRAAARGLDASLTPTERARWIRRHFHLERFAIATISELLTRQSYVDVWP